MFNIKHTIEIPSCCICNVKMDYPKLNLYLIGSEKKEFKKDFFNFCKKCFEDTFGTGILFSTDSTDSLTCHMCESKLITGFPYAYLGCIHKLTNKTLSVGKRRMCKACTKSDLFPIIHSLLEQK